MDSLIAAGNSQAAVTLARGMMGRYGQDPVYRWQIKGRLGLALIRSGQTVESIGPLEEAIRERPGDSNLHRNLAFALKTLGRRGRALAEYGKVVQLAPADPQARLEYGLTLLEFRDFSGAQRELTLAAGLCDHCVDAERVLADLFLDRKYQGKAVPHLARVWASDHSPQVRQLYASALAGSGQGGKALALLAPVPVGQLQAGEWRILVQVEQSDPDLGASWSAKAVDMLDPAKEPNPALPPAIMADGDFWAAAAFNLQRAHHPALALSGLDRALILEPDNVLYQRNRVSVLLDLGRDAEARRAWEEVKRLDPGQQSPQERAP